MWMCFIRCKLKEKNTYKSVCVQSYFLDSTSLSLNAIIIPLFEKVLSAIDVGQIGHSVHPKACVEVSILYT